MIDLQKALGGFWFSSASKFRDGEVVFYHEKGVSIHPLILFPYDVDGLKLHDYKVAALLKIKMWVKQKRQNEDRK